MGAAPCPLCSFPCQFPPLVPALHDRRKKPANRFTPSLKDGDVTNKAITSRAVARKRNTYGMAMGDILLPEGRTVEDLVKEALTKAFRESGYKVTAQPGAKSKDNPKPATASIKKSGMASTSGMWLTTLNQCLEHLIEDVKSRLASGGPEK